MIVHCEKCQAAYQLDESQIGQEGVGVACASCQHRFRVVQKIFYLVETFQEGEEVRTLGIESVKPADPTGESRTLADQSAKVVTHNLEKLPKPKFAKKFSRPWRVEESKSSYWPWLFFFFVVGVSVLVWKNVYSHHYSETMDLVVHRYGRFLASFDSTPVIDAQAKEFFLRGRAESIFDTQTHYQTAVEFYRKSISLAPSYAAAHGALSEAASELAEICQKKDQGQESENWLEETLKSGTRALTLDPEVLEAYRGLATYERAHDRFVKAQELLEKAHQLQPENAESNIALGRLYLGKKDILDLAEKYLKHALVLDERSIRAQRYMAVLHEKRGKVPEAIEHWQKVLDLSAEHEIALQEKGRLEASLKQPISASAKEKLEVPVAKKVEPPEPKSLSLSE